MRTLMASRTTELPLPVSIRSAVTANSTAVPGEPPGRTGPPALREMIRAGDGEWSGVLSIVRSEGRIRNDARPVRWHGRRADPSARRTRGRCDGPHGHPGVRPPPRDHPRDPARRRTEAVVTGASATDGYLAFLIARDGEPDVLRHTLSRREAFLDRLTWDPLRSRLRFDRDGFARNLARRRPERGLDERMLWLLATARANQAERFGVGLGELYGLVDPGDPLRVRIGLQEHYHTRLLADVLGMFDLPVRMHPPPVMARAVIWVLVDIPERWSQPL